MHFVRAVLIEATQRLHDFIELSFLALSRTLLILNVRAYCFSILQHPKFVKRT